MFAIQGKPKDNSEDWVFCTGEKDTPDLFFTEECGFDELEEWRASTPDWKYRIVAVKLVVEEFVGQAF